MYLAVRILFLEYVWIGLPSSSFKSAGSGRLKNKVLLSPSSSDVVVLRASASLFGSSSTTVSSAPWLPLDWLDPPDWRLFSVASFFFILSMMEIRLRPLLLTVSLRVAHLDRVVARSGWSDPSSFAMVRGVSGSARLLQLSPPDSFPLPSRYLFLLRCRCDRETQAGSWQARLQGLRIRSITANVPMRARTYKQLPQQL